ncbi:MULTISPECIES: hypothetical protein [Bacillus]|uniref:Lipoprotein n=1 Tax=Bacillus cereus TaxID=1396 RepID=A0A164KVH3_BACCE|nr:MULTISPECIES: hypothetical protein [Bacillus]KZD51742.1 hypothetical protein B4088_5916 [Bacillus cereus]TSI11207.1 hypothetical protein FOT98_21295 [Bacillus sp. HY001]
MKAFKMSLVIGIALMMLAGCGDTEQAQEPAKQSQKKVNYAQEWDKKEEKRIKEEQERKAAEDYFKKYPFLKDSLGSDTLEYSTIKKIAKNEGLSLEEYAQDRLETMQKAEEAEKERKEKYNDGINPDTCGLAEKAVNYQKEARENGEKVTNNREIRAHTEARWKYDKCKKQGFIK